MDIDPHPSEPEPDGYDLSWQKALRATFDIYFDVVDSLEINQVFPDIEITKSTIFTKQKPWFLTPLDLYDNFN